MNIQISSINCFQSVLTTVPRGQLGNHLHTYALLSSLQAHLPSLTFSLSSETRAYLTTYFRAPPLLLSSIDSLCLCKSHGGVYSRPWSWSTWSSQKDQDFAEVTWTYSFVRHMTEPDAVKTCYECRDWMSYPYKSLGQSGCCGPRVASPMWRVRVGWTSWTNRARECWSH